MLLENKRILLGVTSSFYNIERMLQQIKKIEKEGAEIIPVASFDIYNKTKSDIMAIIPCNSNTISKLANGIIDTPVLATAKLVLQHEKNIVIGIATRRRLITRSGKHRKTFKTKKHILCTV